MFGPQHLPHLVRYFDGIDAALSRKLLRRNPPHEPSLTEEFCALMDADAQRAERLLEFDIDDLNVELARAGGGLNINFQIDVHPHSTRMEAYVSQADFALVLQYDNHFLRSESWTAAYLVQAKRLHRSMAGSYDEMAGFNGLSPAQREAIDDLRSVLGPEALKYCLYCPPTSGLEPTFRERVRSLHIRNLQDRFFDGAYGLALRDSLIRTPGIEAGVWFTGASEALRGAVGLHDQAFRLATPLTWFILDHFAPTMAHDEPASALNSTANGGASDKVDRVRRLAEGDAHEIECLIKQLGEKARSADFSVENLKILPASTVTVRVSALDRIEPSLLDVLF